MGFSDGDFLLIEYTVRVKETGTIIDTTNEELAKKENIYESGRVYGPILVVLGKGWINSVVEEALKDMDIGSEKEVEVPPEKAFGRRDPSKVKVFSIREFRRRNIDVKVGDVIEVGGARGIVKSISGGRVVVDFNHPLADKTLVFKVKVVDKLEKLEDKVRALAVRHLQVPGDEITIEYQPDEKKLVIALPSKYVAKKDIQYAKISLAADIYSFFKDMIKKLEFHEVFEFEKPKETEKPEETEKQPVEKSEAGGEEQGGE